MEKSKPSGLKIESVANRSTKYPDSSPPVEIRDPS
jgi:hypothetical protein